MEDPLKMINDLIKATASPVALPSIPTLDIQFPNANDLDAKWKEFLERAQKDPDIISYYKKKLDQAVGDTNLARSFLEKDYQMGTRHTGEGLGGALEALGLTFNQEDRTLADNLNKRGIALTDMGGGQTQYAGGGVAKTELGMLTDSQRLRKEAEQRTARQGVEKLGLAREKGLTSTGRQLADTATDLQQGQKTDTLNRANLYSGLYQNQQTTEANKKLLSQNSGTSGSTGSSTDKSAINPDTGKQYAVNPSSGVWDDSYYSQTYG